MAMIDADGNVKAAYQYDPYGRLRGWTGPEADDNPFRFSTKLWLVLGPVYYGNAGEFNMTYGLYYYGYRYYAPKLQRWISRDPVGGGELYIYVANAPFTYIDPYGLWWWDNDILEWGLGSILGFHGKEAREAAIDAAAEYIYKHGPARGGWINVSCFLKEREEDIKVRNLVRWEIFL